GGPVRVGVDQRRVVFEVVVHLGHLAVDGRVDVTHRLRRLNLPARLTGRHPGARRGNGDVDDIAERLLGVVGDAHGSDGAADRDPLVLRGVAQFVGDGHGRLLLETVVGAGQGASGRLFSAAGGRTAGP